MANSEPVRSRKFSGGDLTLLPRQGYSASYQQTSHGVGFAFDRQRGRHAFASSRVQSFDTLANTLAFVPVGCDVFSESDEGGEYLKINLSEEPCCLKPLQQAVNGIHDRRALRAAQQLRKALLQNVAVETLRIDDWVDALTTPLQNTDAKAPACFSEREKRRIADWIETYLQDSLSVAAMAQACNLSEGYFARRFKQSFAQSPHDFVLERRVARARQQVFQTQTALTEIALDCGFSSHAHMSSAFQQRLGISPSRLRQQQ